ncbi:MAG: hypothetical protein GY943_07740 [Chloroflexi bacterium]|nr:hypothetical protein [Chloroflexota bacterium]
MRKSVWLFILIIVTACTAPNPPPSSPVPTIAIMQPSPVAIPATFTPGGVPVLPTRPVSTPRPTPPPLPTSLADTPIPFDNIVVELTYQIPALGLNRRLEGNVGSDIVLIDETSGKGQQRSRQATVLLQLQQALKNLELAPVPDGCVTCVFVSFNLPYEQKEESGWLQDPILLASIENFMTVALGAHFPPGAVAGLRRSASPFAPAQTIALMEDGRLWVWQGNKDTVPESLTADPALFTAVSTGMVAETKNSYVATCTSVPAETLLMRAGEQEKVISIACPEFSIPTPLLPLYQQFDAVMATHLTDNIERPPVGFSLDGLVDYQRADRVNLTIFANGTAVAQDASGTYTTTLTSREIISLTQSLIDSGAIQLGLTTYESDEDADETSVPTSRILVRGDAGVYDGEWTTFADIPALAALNELLAQMIPSDAGLPETAVPSPTITPTAAP